MALCHEPSSPPCCGLTAAGGVIRREMTQRPAECSDSVKVHGPTQSKGPQNRLQLRRAFSGPSFELPLRIDIATGEKLEPTGLNPYALPWVSGAAATLPRQTRTKYAAQLTDLIERLTVLRSRRPEDFEERLTEFYRHQDRVRTKIQQHEARTLYGPEPRSATFRALDQRPAPSSPDLFDCEADNQ